MKDLPPFLHRFHATTHDYASRVFTSPGQDFSHLLDLIQYEDEHFRAIFRVGFFVLAEGASEPSKSQWNTLKKRMKRIHKGVFVFKEHGLLEHQGQACGYVDFGFLDPS
jgi:hypothetical protein